MTKSAYKEVGEWSGFSVRKSSKGFIFSNDSRIQGAIDGVVILIPYGSVAGYKEDADLSAKHNDFFTIGGILAESALDFLKADQKEEFKTRGFRFIRKGAEVR